MSAASSLRPSDIDRAITLLAEVARAHAAHFIALEVRIDGRVEIELNGQRLRADLLGGGAYPSPGEILATSEAP